MKTNLNRATARLSKNGKYLIVDCNGQNAILNANLIRYLFDVRTHEKMALVFRAPKFSK